MSTTSKRTAAILISGRGSNMSALIEAAGKDDFPVRIAGVISNRSDATGLASAQAADIPVQIIDNKNFADREAHDAALDEAIADLDAEIVCLAGYMRILSKGFVEKWAGRMVNIHPALLPLFRGLDTHRQALDAGMMIHGCTVHFVTSEPDGGPIIAQAAVPVLAGDTKETLAARVLKAEHQLYPLALAMVATGMARMDDGRTVFAGADAHGHTDPRILVSPEPTDTGPVDLESLARFTP